MFITFEGVEGAGKTTQIARLAARLREQPGMPDVLVTREPGAGLLGKELRALVLRPNAEYVVAPRAELLIMLADRAQHVAEMIRPHLDSGGIVICDRYGDSSVAYQGYGRGLNVDEIEAFNACATDKLVPKATFLLDLDPAVGLDRQSERTRMEGEALAFHQRVRDGFLALASKHPERFIVIDASRSPDAIHEDLWQKADGDSCNRMKLILAIVHDRDKHKLTDRLLQQGLAFTQIGSTGGFLRQGNVTILLGVPDESVDLVFELLRSACGTVEKFVNVPAGDAVMGLASATLFPPHPVKVAAGGAVAFVLNVERFEKF